jgi:hypothetical protein
LVGEFAGISVIPPAHSESEKLFAKKRIISVLRLTVGKSAASPQWILNLTLYTDGLPP